MSLHTVSSYAPGLLIRHRSSNIQILGLCLLDGRPRFVELSKSEGFSHIGLLRGPYIGCGLRDDISVPHLVNWRTQEFYALAQEPNPRASIYMLLSSSSS